MHPLAGYSSGDCHEPTQYFHTLVTPAATTLVYTNQGYRTAFRVVTNDTLIGRTLACHAPGALKAKKIAVIDDRTAFGQGLADQGRKVNLQVVRGK